MSTRKKIIHPIALQRTAKGWSQAVLAERAGIPRSTLSAIESHRLTPSVTAALALAKALDTTVEALFDPSATREWAWALEPEIDTARFSVAQIGDQILAFPVESLTVNLFPHDGLWRRTAGFEYSGDRSALAAQTLVVACCDPAAGLLASTLARTTGVRLIVLQRGGLAALDLLRRGLVHLAGLHFSTEEEPQRNEEIVRRELGPGHQLIHIASWEEGLALPVSERRSHLGSLTNEGNTWALRETGSAARDCLDTFLEGKDTPQGRLVSGHASVANSIREGWASTGVCVRISAEEAGLAFKMLRRETLDFCLPNALLDDPRVKALIRVLRSREYRQTLNELPGYDASETGIILPC